MMEKLNLQEPQELEKRLTEWTMEYVNRELAACNTTLFHFPRVCFEKPIRKSVLFGRSSLSKIYHDFLVLNTGLGNRKEVNGEGKILICPLCNDQTKVFNEVHMLLECRILDKDRDGTSLNDFIKNYEGVNLTSMYSNYWWNWTGLEELYRRIDDAKSIREAFERERKI